MLLEKKAKGLHTSSRLLRRALIKANIPPSSRGLSLNNIQQNLQDAFKAYYKVKGLDKELRSSYTEKLVEAIAAAGNTSKEKTLKLIRQQERQWSTAHKIKFLQRKLNTGSTTIVTIQKEDGTVEIYLL
jgi:hypothetical protein